MVTRRTHQQALDEQKSQYERQLTDQRAIFDQALSTLRTDYEAKIANLKSDFKSQYEQDLTEIQTLIDSVEKRNHQQQDVIRQISEDFAEAKQQILAWQDEQGRITQYEGILLIQEIIDKLLQRFDFYFLSGENQFPETGLNLQYTRDNFFKAAREKGAMMENVISANAHAMPKS
jgi:hypothetical protein